MIQLERLALVGLLLVSSDGALAEAIPPPDEGGAKEVYVSVDIESDGPIPGPHSMLSLGSAAYTEDCERVSTFSMNLELLEGATGHPDNMAWWGENQAAWEASRREPRPPAEAMPEYAEWLEDLPGRPVFVGYPAAWDFMFVQWYLHRFAGRSPFGHSALDIRSYAMAVLREPYWRISKSTMPERWIPEARHTHVAVDDAIEQGELFCNILGD